MAYDVNRGWAKGDPIPMAGDLGPLAPDAAGLTGRGGSDLFSGGSGVNSFSSTPQASSNFDWSFSSGLKGNEFDYIDRGQYAGGSNPEGTGTSSDPSKGGPSFSSVVTGMMNGPGGSSGNSASGVAGIELWLESWFVRIAIIVLGFIFIAAGLSMMKNPIVVEARNAVRGLAV